MGEAVPGAVGVQGVEHVADGDGVGAHEGVERQQRGGQGLTLVHVRAQLEQLQGTFLNYLGLYGGQRSSS